MNEMTRKRDLSCTFMQAGKLVLQLQRRRSGQVWGRDQTSTTLKIFSLSELREGVRTLTNVSGYKYWNRSTMPADT